MPELDRQKQEETLSLIRHYAVKVGSVFDTRPSAAKSVADWVKRMGQLVRDLETRS